MTKRTTLVGALIAAALAAPVSDACAAGNPLAALPPRAYVVGTFDRGVARLYVDGKLAGQTHIRGRIDRSKYPLEIGSFIGGSVWAGKIDEVALYRQALPASVISKHYELGIDPKPPSTSAYDKLVSRTSGLAGYWRLGDRGHVAIDSHGHNNGVYGAGLSQSQPGLITDESDLATGFNGHAGSVTVPASRSPGFSGPFSLEAWVTVDSVGNRVIVARVGSYFLKTDPFGHWGFGVYSAGEIQDVYSHVATHGPRAPAVHHPEPTGGSSFDPLWLLVLAAIAGAALALRHRLRPRGGDKPKSATARSATSARAGASVRGRSAALRSAPGARPGRASAARPARPAPAIGHKPGSGNGAERAPAKAARSVRAPRNSKTKLPVGRMPHIDSLRAIAALSVLLIHTGWFSGLNYVRGVGQFNQRLDVGVAVFFVISGVLLYRPFALAHLKGSSAPTTGPYAWRRFLRIVPAYWLALTVTVLLVGTRKFSPAVFTLGGIPRYYLFAQDYGRWSIAGGLGQAWTLSIEVAFYAFLPLYAWLQRHSDAGPNRALRTEVAGLLALVAISEIWKYFVLAGGSHSRVAVTPGLVCLPAYLDQFALGMGLALLSAWIEVRGNNPRWVATYDRFPGVAWLVALLAFWAVSVEVLPGRAGASWDIAQYLGRQWLYGVIGLCLVFPAIVGDQSRGLVRRLLGIRLLAWLGLISYGIYLWHVTIMEELQNLGFNPHDDLKAYIEWPVITLVVTVAVAAASYYLLERPVLSLKRIFDRRPSRTRPEPAAVGTLAQR